MINEEKYVQLNYINFNKKLRVCFNRMECHIFIQLKIFGQQRALLLHVVTSRLHDILQ